MSSSDLFSCGLKWARWRKVRRDRCRGNVKLQAGMISVSCVVIFSAQRRTWWPWMTSVSKQVNLTLLLPPDLSFTSVCRCLTPFPLPQTRRRLNLVGKSLLLPPPVAGAPLVSCSPSDVPVVSSPNSLAHWWENVRGAQRRWDFVFFNLIYTVYLK